MTNTELVIKARDYAVERSKAYKRPIPNWLRKYIKSDYYWMYHHCRYKRYVDEHGLLCQECGGAGGEVDVIFDDGTGPWEMCGYCEGTGLVTRWIRGEWLRWKKQEKKERSKQWETKT